MPMPTPVLSAVMTGPTIQELETPPIERTLGYAGVVVWTRRARVGESSKPAQPVTVTA
jgi:hypothetical protein